MIGIVLVSHSAALADGILELVRQMVGDRVPLAAAGGTSVAAAPIGTDPLKVLAAIEAVYSADGVLVLMDMGSAIMSAEAAIDMLPGDQQHHIYLCEAPLVEGTLAAAVRAMTGGSIEQVFAEARSALAAKADQLSPLLRTPAVAASAAAQAFAETDSGDQAGLCALLPDAYAAGPARAPCGTPCQPLQPIRRPGHDCLSWPHGAGNQYEPGRHPGRPPRRHPDHPRRGCRGCTGAGCDRDAGG